MHNKIMIAANYLLNQDISCLSLRAWNFILSYFDLKFKVSNCHSRPVQLFIEPSAACNLRCVFCICSDKEYRPAKQFLTLKDYEVIIDEAHPYAISVTLYLNGEPFLNKHIAEMVGYNTLKGMFSTIHTNMNLMSEELAENLINAGLFRLIISCDGVSQDSYEKYRVGGSVETVLRNIEMFLAVRKKLKRKNPIVTWRYNVNRYNEHEVDRARDLAKKLGIDVFSTGFFHIPDDKKSRIEWAPVQNSYSLYEKESLKEKFMPLEFCNSLWDTLIVDCDGNAYFCFPTGTKRDSSYGNIFSSSIKELWNCSNIRTARGLVRGSFSDSGHCCSSCKWLPKNFNQIVARKA